MASMANANKAALREQLRRMEVLLNKPENRECFDCNCKGPRWASINLGIFICMRCAGIHRSLGTHITKVRSINMDLWEAQNIEFIEKMGNGNGRLVYEAKLPASYRKPDVNAESKDMERILREKWELRRYYAPDAEQRIKDVLEGRLQSSPIDEAGIPPASPVSLVSPQSPQPMNTGAQAQLLGGISISSAPSTSSPVSAVAPLQGPPIITQQASTAPPKQRSDIDLLDFNAPIVTNTHQSAPIDLFSAAAPVFQDSSKANIMAAFEGPRQPQQQPPLRPGGGVPPLPGQQPWGFPPGPNGPPQPAGAPPGQFGWAPPQNRPPVTFAPSQPPNFNNNTSNMGFPPQGPPPIHQAPQPFVLPGGPPPIQSGGWR